MDSHSLALTDNINAILLVLGVLCAGAHMAGLMSASHEGMLDVVHSAVAARLGLQNKI